MGVGSTIHYSRFSEYKQPQLMTKLELKRNAYSLNDKSAQINQKLLPDFVISPSQSQQKLTKQLSVDFTLNEILSINNIEGFIEDQPNKDYIKMSTAKLQQLLGFDEDEDYVD